MKKVTAFIGTQSRKATYLAVQEFERDLKQLGDIDFEYVFLHEHRLEFCRGCKQCFLKGEEFCPSKDDRDVLIAKIEHSDGIILATPTYTFQVTARMKNFLDRLAFICHRPRFFGKVCTVIVTQGIYGGGDILKYLNFAAASMGFQISKGFYATTLDPITKRQMKKLLLEIKKSSARFYKELQHPLPPPSLLGFMAFHMGRSAIKFGDKNLHDYQYYKEKGWFGSDYYYPTTLGLMQKLTGNLFDFIGQQWIKHQ
jgi:multimeric flavodoxin WrbA